MEKIREAPGFDPACALCRNAAGIDLSEHMDAASRCDWHKAWETGKKDALSAPVASDAREAFGFVREYPEDSWDTEDDLTHLVRSIAWVDGTDAQGRLLYHHHKDTAAALIERYVAERERKAREALEDWLKFSSDVIPSCAAGDDWLGSLQERTRALLVRESAEPAEERTCATCGHFELDAWGECADECTTCLGGGNYKPAEVGGKA